MMVIGTSFLEHCIGKKEYHADSDKELCHNDILGMNNNSCHRYIYFGGYFLFGLTV